jgi:hypothetical protein
LQAGAFRAVYFARAYIFDVTNPAEARFKRWAVVIGFAACLIDVFSGKIIIEAG